MKSSCLNVFQRNNCVVIKINDGSEFEDIKKEVKKKVTQLKKIYKDDKTPIKVIGRTLKNNEIEQIETILKNNERILSKYEKEVIDILEGENNNDN